MKKLLLLFCILMLTNQQSYAQESYIEENLEPIKLIKLQPVKYVSAGHILVNTYEEAAELKKRIDSGESFEKLAAEYSKCPSAKRGGALGTFGRGQMVKPFENAAFNLDVGQVSDPVKTNFGWHLIKVYDRKS